MKRFSIIALAFVCLLCAGCGAKEHERVPLEELSEYTLDQAKDGGCVVFESTDISAGQEIWEAFVSDCAAGKSADVRLYWYYTLAPEYSAPEYYISEKDNYPMAFVQDLSFDGEKYTIRWLEDGQEYVREYEYLLRCEGESEHYLLAHDESVTWEEYVLSMASSQFGAAIDAVIVYTDLIY